MNPFRSMLPRGASFVLFLLLGVALSGCSTTESENESVRPWNTPKSWETGLPGGMNEGR